MKASIKYKTLKKLSIVFLFYSILSVGHLSAQRISTVEDINSFVEKYDANIETMWHKVLAVSDVDSFSKLLNKYDDEVLFKVIPSILIGDSIDISILDFRAKLKSYLPPTPFDTILSDDEIMLIINHQELTNWVADDLTRFDSTISLWKKSPTRKELYFYDIKPDQTVLEVGAGRGSFGILASLLYPETQFYLNDIDTNKIRTIEKRTQFFNSGNSNNITTRIGTETSTNFDQIADIIILRRAMHHFSDIPAMLTNIKKSMSDQSILFIKESIKSDCTKHLPIKKILRIMRKNNFRFLYRKDFYGEVCLAYETR